MKVQIWYFNCDIRWQWVDYRQCKRPLTKSDIRWQYGLVFDQGMTVQDSDQMKTSLAFQKCRFFSIAIAIAIIISMPSELSSHHCRYPNCHHHLECDQHQHQHHHHLDCDRHQSSALPDPTLAPTPEQIAQHRSSPLNNVQTNKHQSWLLSTVHHPLKSFESIWPIGDLLCCVFQV